MVEMNKLPPQVVVVGSHAPGIFMRVQRIPKAGETVIGWDFHEPMDGGKGSNQAIAAARLGLLTSFVGCLGKDRLAVEAENWLGEAGVDLSHLYYSQTKSTGIGFILLDADGVPAMVTSMGANEELDETRVERALAELARAQVMLTQFEIRPTVALHAARVARQYGMLAIVNPAPAADLRAADLSVADILTPNETEAKLLLGYEPDAPIETAALAQELLIESRVSCVLVTLGEKGIVGADSSGSWQETPPSVTVVDTSGAGDVFCAALAVGIVNGQDYRSASRWACKVATLSVTKAGTIPAYPTLAEVKTFLQTL
jgi:ribokinase